MKTGQILLAIFFWALLVGLIVWVVMATKSARVEHAYKDNGCHKDCKCLEDDPRVSWDKSFTALKNADNRTFCGAVVNGFRVGCPSGCCNPRCT